MLETSENHNWLHWPYLSIRRNVVRQLKKVAALTSRQLQKVETALFCRTVLKFLYGIRHILIEIATFSWNQRHFHGISNMLKELATFFVQLTQFWCNSLATYSKNNITTSFDLMKSDITQYKSIAVNTCWSKVNHKSYSAT